MRNPAVRRVVVIGTSAGGMDALRRLVSALPAGLPAPVLIVQHLAPNMTGQVLVDALGKAGALPCKQGEDGETIRAGRIYVAPPDHHMLVVNGRLMISKGASENRSRPAIDPLFRSAAVAFGSRTIGVVLTGLLNDGTAGLIAIRRCGGVCLVQDPEDAAYPEMPLSALSKVKEAHRLGLDALGPRLVELAGGPLPKHVPIPEDVAAEARIAERVASDVGAVEKLGTQTPFNCPDCGGVLWEIEKSKQLRFRCHTGHAFTSAVLEAEQEKRIEETLWVALRMLEERRDLLQKLADPASRAYSRTARARADECKTHVDRIRRLLRIDRDTGRAAATSGRRAGP